MGLRQDSGPGRPRAVSAVVVLAGVLSCGGCASTQGDAALPSSPASEQAGPVPVVDSDSMRLRQSPPPLLSEADTAGAESTPWKAISSAGRVLTIRYVIGDGCRRFTGIRVLETPEAVEVWSVVTTDTAAQMCNDSLSFGAAAVTLDRPLGVRALLHAPLSKQWRSEADILE